MTKKKILMASPLMPEFDRESGSLRIFDLLRMLREAGHAVSFVAENGSGDRYVRLLQQLGVATYVGFGQRTDQLIAYGGFDLAIFAFWYTAERYLPTIRALSPGTRVVVDSIDLHFVRQARKTFLDLGAGRFAPRVDDTYGLEMMRELNAYAAADAVFTVSKKEADVVDNLVGGENRSYVVPDNEELSLSPVSESERKGILFVGNFRHPPNLQAAEYLCGDILPRIDPAILARDPVYIVGNDVPESICAAARNLSGVRLVGWVPSVLPYFQRARISVVPLRYGAGTKRKLVQALMTGTPTVTTTIGVEGLGAEHGRHVLIADDAEDFATSMVRLLQDLRLWRQFARQGREHIVASHGRNAARSCLLQALDAVFAKNTRPDADSKLSAQHMGPEQHQDLIARIRGVVNRILPRDVPVIVVNQCDQDLLTLGPRPAWSFPRGGNGAFPPDSKTAIQWLEKARAAGAGFLLFPSTALGWLDYYHDFGRHLAEKYGTLYRDDQSCLIVALGGGMAVESSG